MLHFLFCYRNINDIFECVDEAFRAGSFVVASLNFLYSLVLLAEFVFVNYAITDPRL